jgi:hypothetical protein
MKRALVLLVLLAGPAGCRPQDFAHYCTIAQREQAALDACAKAPNCKSTPNDFHELESDRAFCEWSKKGGE